MSENIGEARNQSVGCLSDFCNRLKAKGRILEEEGWYIWGCSPIYDRDGKVHIFFSRWPVETGFKGWRTDSEIAHAVADQPEGPYTVMGTVLEGRGGDYWDSMTIHNPTIHFVNDNYYLFYIGNSDGTADTQRIGLATAESLYGPWRRISDNEPLLDVSEDRGCWDSYITTNPALLVHEDSRFWLYYKAWDRYNDGLRKMGIAIADNIEGPYIKHDKNPIIDFSDRGAQVEDAYVYREKDEYHMIMRDMGVFGDRSGLHLCSEDGLNWSEPLIGYKSCDAYFDDKDQRFERPQVLVKGQKAAYLFLALAGGQYGTSTGAVLEVDNEGDSNDR